MKKLIVGLGNLGDKYKNTKHNAGFIFVDRLAHVNNATFKLEKKFESEVATFEGAILAKPITFMNNSGSAVEKLVKYYDINPDNLLVVHDDVDLPINTYKLKKNSSSAGHHGVDDIIQKLGTQDFWRLRIGVGRPADNKFEVGDFVFSLFSKTELNFIKGIKVPF